MKLTFNKNLPKDFSLDNFYGVIYIIINLINSKIYIGQTINLKRRIRSYKNTSCKCQKHLYNALKKYGVSNFEIQILDVAPNQEVLNFLECFYIDILNSTNKEIGYNLTRGRNCKKHLGEKSRRKAIDTRCRPRTQEEKDLIAKSTKKAMGNEIVKNKMKGPKSAEHKQKMSMSKTGKKTRPHKQESIEKMKIAKKLWWDKQKGLI